MPIHIADFGDPVAKRANELLAQAKLTVEEENLLMGAIMRPGEPDPDLTEWLNREFPNGRHGGFEMQDMVALLELRIQAQQQREG